MNTDCALVIHDLHVGDSSVRVHAPGSDRWAAEWIAGLEGRARGADAFGQPDLTLVVGSLAQVTTFLPTLQVAGAVPTVILAPGCASEVNSLSREDWDGVLGLLGGCQSVLVSDRTDLRALSARAPRMVALIADAAGTAPRDVVLGEAQRAGSALGTVLVHTGDPWATEPFASLDIRLLRDRLEDLGQGPALSEHWLPAEAAKRDSEGHVEARRAAWYLHCAAVTTQAQLLLTDRFDVLNALVTSPNIRVPIGWFVAADALRGMLRRPPRNFVGVLRRLRSSHGLVVVAHERCKGLLKDLGDEGPVTVLDPFATSCETDLADVVNLVRPMVRLERDTTLLIAGHDFKFLGELAGCLGTVPELRVQYDTWPAQDRHDVGESDDALEAADVILCEFASHNAVWYSWHKRPGQRLVVRFHGYELFQEQVRDINVANVDCFVFVSQFYRDRVSKELGWPVEKTAVIPNMVDPSEFDHPKELDARFHLGIVGIVPILKRPDRALDLLEALLAHDDRYVLHIRGRAPWDYNWVWQQPAVQDAYRSVYERLAEDPELLAHVAFDEFGADMGQWFRRIGWTLSPSYRETFHLAPVEGQMSGAVPVVWAREGAMEIFGERWVHEDTEAAAEFVRRTNVSSDSYAETSRLARNEATRYEVNSVAPLWADVLFPGEAGVAGVDERFDSGLMDEALARTATSELVDRRIVLALARGETPSELVSLLDRHPEQAAVISRHTRGDLARAHDEHLLRSGAIRCAPRVDGAAYLPRHGIDLRVACHYPQEIVTLDGPKSRQTVMTMHVGESMVGEPISVRPGDSFTSTLEVLADAVVRTARVHRPSVIAVDPASVMAWPALVAARRLGVPAIAHGSWDEAQPAPSEVEFDAVVTRDRPIAPEDMELARRRHHELASAEGSRHLHEIVVGLIADEFTATTISARCSTIRIPRQDAYLSVISHDLDVLFVESAWSGPDKEWFHGVAYYPDCREDIERAIAAARARCIPVVFWNKEDPVHFRSFAPTAALCDAVYTTDAAKIPEYLQLFPLGATPVVASMPFYAEPLLHNPLPGAWEPVHTICYAGTYYGDRYADRSHQLDQILQQAAPLGLSIYDRQATIQKSPYRFPEAYAQHIHGGLSYREVLEAYKAHPVHINVNSVNESPTMYSRRVVEIAASGGVVASGPGAGLRASIPDIQESDDVAELGAFMERCMRSPEFWRKQAWRQLRAVRRSYLAEQSLAIMLRGVGIPVALPPAGLWAAHVEELNSHVAQQLLDQTLPPVEVVAQKCTEDAAALLASRGVAVVTHASAPWSAEWSGARDKTWAEDLLYASRFLTADVSLIGSRAAHASEHGLAVWEDIADPHAMRRRGDRRATRGLMWLTAVDTRESDSSDD